MCSVSASISKVSKKTFSFLTFLVFVVSRINRNKDFAAMEFVTILTATIAIFGQWCLIFQLSKQVGEWTEVERVILRHIRHLRGLTEHHLGM